MVLVLPTVHLLLFSLVPDRPQTDSDLWLRVWGISEQHDGREISYVSL